MNVELTIEGVGLMGQGVAHDSAGNLYFVPQALPGDRIIAAFQETEKKYRDATLVSIQSPSPQRRESVCRHFSECGGCDWLDWDYDAQVTAKEGILRHVLERSTWMPEKSLPTLRAEKTLGYRNRIQLRGDGRRLGFYRRKSHDIVDIEECPVSDPRLNKELPALREELVGTAGTRKVELALQTDGRILRLDNQPHAAAGFAQVHEEQNEKLKGAISEILTRVGSQSVLELYSGNGNLTSAYAERVDELFAVDSCAATIEQARARFSTLPSLRASFLQTRIDSKLRRTLPREFRERCDTLLLDPPRAGAEGALEPLLEKQLRTIVYVSCSPVAFTKDVQCLKEGFQFDQVQIIDMFPHTRHIEFVACFSRLPC